MPDGSAIEPGWVWTVPAVQEDSYVSAKRSGVAIDPGFECSVWPLILMLPKPNLGWNLTSRVCVFVPHCVTSVVAFV
jgi:hypothetical protein